MVTSTWKK